jgi:signal transduction histidine kinase/ActR/RegA family two-component response regulator
MFLFDRIDFLALVGLWVQAFVAWVFVAILRALRTRELDSGALDSFYRAFLALAWSLTVLCVRFFSTHDLVSPEVWRDGSLLASGAYMLYLALKATFGLYIVRGCYELVGERPGKWLRRAWWPTIVLLALAPIPVPSMPALLTVQMPVMVACAFFALRVLRRQPRDEQGMRLVRYSLTGLLVTWCAHGTVAFFVDKFPMLRYAMSLNSLVDVAVQLMLGLGLVVSALQDSHRRMREAVLERERLERELARDEKLRALGTLVSGVAHELNNPLTVILGYAEILSSTPQVASTVRIIEEQAERCRGIVRNLSALAGQAAQSPEELDVRELVERVIRGLAPQERALGRRMTIGNIEPERLRADRTGLEQVLSNLIANALDASPPNGEVTIDARSIGDSVEFNVIDQGAGVPQSLRARLFEPFFTTKRPGKGTGLGLAIAHAIVRGHGGTISVDEAPAGFGAVFHVVIPNATARAEPPPRRVEGAPGRRLLVLDDDKAVRMVLRRHAERRGWVVDEADCAESALATKNRLAQYDAILCDLRMPGMGGVGFHDLLERDGSPLLERTVFATGDLASPEAVTFSKRCKRPLIQKPFVFDELFAVLDDTVGPRAPALSGGA